MKNRLALILILTILLSSCDFNINNNKKDLGTISSVKPQTIGNIYTANKKICESKELPFTQFSVEYPNGFDVKTPSDKQNHIIIKKKFDNIIVEEFTIGNSTVTLKNKNLALELVENIADNFKRQFPDLKIIFIGKKEFNGELTYLFEGEVDYSDFESHGYKGVYKLMFLLPMPKSNEELNAVLISFISNAQSDIKSFDDFANTGMIGQVYKTFKYIE
jgi:hypothetical protein